MEFSTLKAASSFLRRKGYKKLEAGVYGYGSTKFRAHIASYRNDRLKPRSSDAKGNDNSSYSYEGEDGYIVTFWPSMENNAAHEQKRDAIGGLAYQ